MMAELVNVTVTGLQVIALAETVIVVVGLVAALAIVAWYCRR